eukprot:GHVT01057092.1.p1 GENE.GHVT01057092.1~~GHVT01057092.1.p1  ORF type:complete len:112 (+),score=6.57 GHVT01057092.1:167-502(+)
MGLLNSIVVINTPNFQAEDSTSEVPQLKSLVLMWQGNDYRANIDGETYIGNFANLPASWRLKGHEDKPNDGTVTQSRKEAAERFVEIFEAYPSLNTMSLIVYATSKQWSKM